MVVSCQLEIKPPVAYNNGIKGRTAGCSGIQGKCKITRYYILYRIQDRYVKLTRAAVNDIFQGPVIVPVLLLLIGNLERVYNITCVQNTRGGKRGAMKPDAEMACLRFFTVALQFEIEALAGISGKSAEIRMYGRSSPAEP